ncbi:MAG: TRAP transporter small permease [Proteobacteria bacterium]|nr:TRAP transporter small permease [Pseudomonadota bacterium]
MLERSRAAGVFGRFTLALNALGTIWIFALMVLINADIGGRALLSAPIPGVPEIVSLSIVGIVFLQIPHTLRMGHFVRSDAFGTRMMARAPRAANALEAIFHALGACLFAILLWASYPSFVKAWRDDLFVGAIGHIVVPTWPINLIILISCFAMAVQYLRLAWKHAQRCLRAGTVLGDDETVAGVAP